MMTEETRHPSLTEIYLDRIAHNEAMAEAESRPVEDRWRHYRQRGRELLLAIRRGAQGTKAAS